MKQTIEIEVPEGKRAVWKNNTIVFKDIKPKLPKTWEEFCNNNSIKPNEYFITDDSKICRWFIEKYRQPNNKNILPSKEAVEQHLALMQLHQLRDCYRQGWVPNWKDTESIKYYIIYADNNCTIMTCCVSIKFLSFQSREIAEEFLNNFKDLIEQAGDLI